MGSKIRGRGMFTNGKVGASKPQPTLSVHTNVTFSSGSDVPYGNQFQHLTFMNWHFLNDEGIATACLYLSGRHSLQYGHALPLRITCAAPVPGLLVMTFLLLVC